MSSIENRDVKSLSEIQALGGEKSDLTHDAKIYVTAKGLNKTLAEIIESGEIADGNRFGADIKNFALAIADGSGEEYNTDVPYVNGSGHTQLDLHFEIKDLEVAQLYVGGEHIPKYINDNTTKNNWWRIVDLTTIEIKGDITDRTEDINFIVFRGSEIPVVPSVFAGLKVENEAFGFTDSPNGDGVSNVTVADNKTVIEFDFDILPNSVIFVYVDGELWPVQTPSNNTGHWYQKLSKNTITLGEDLSGSTTPFYVAVFQGKSQIDEFGNMVVTLKPQIASFILESDNGTKWYIASGQNGELEIDSVVTADLADRILFRRDDGTIVELFVEDTGQLSVDLPVNAGILFEKIFLTDIEGLVREFGALNDNTPYTIPHGQNFFELIRPNGKVIKRIMAFENNAVLESTGYVEEEELEAIVSEPNQTVTTSMVKREDGLFSLFKWNTISQKWEDWITKLIESRLAKITFRTPRRAYIYMWGNGGSNSGSNGTFNLYSVSKFFGSADLFDINLSNPNSGNWHIRAKVDLWVNASAWAGGNSSHAYHTLYANNYVIAQTHEHQGSTAGHSIGAPVFLPKGTTVRFYKDFWPDTCSSAHLHITAVEHIEEMVNIN